MPESNLLPLSKGRPIVARYRAYLNGVAGMAYEAQHYDDPGGLQAASVARSSLTAHGAAAGVLKRFGRVSVLGTMSGAYEADGSNVFDVKFIGILTAQKHSAGSACASFTANNNPKYADQVVFGHFELLGGTGPAARVRAAATSPASKRASGRARIPHRSSQFDWGSSTFRWGIAAGCPRRAAPRFCHRQRCR